MKKTSSLTSPNDFDSVFQSGLMSSSRYIVLRYLCRNDQEESKVAFAAGKRYGKAVERNRAKRLLRESYRRNREIIIPGYDIVVIARACLRGKTYWEAEKGLLDVLKTSGLIKREN